MSLLLLVTRTVQSKFTHLGVIESCNSVTCPLLRSPLGSISAEAGANGAAIYGSRCATNTLRPHCPYFGLGRTGTESFSVPTSVDT